MNLLKNKILSVSLFAAILVAGLFTVLQANASVSSYTASAFSQFCAANPSTCNKVDFNDTTSGSVSCPSANQVISHVYVHAGDGQTVYELPDAGFNLNFTNNNNTANVSLATHPHNLSWIGVTCTSTTPTPSASPTPTVTPTVTPTPTVSPTPTVTPTPTPITCGQNEVLQNGICIEIHCDGGDDCEVVIGSPTPTQTPTDTVTPTPTTGTSTVQSSTGDGRSDGHTESLGGQAPAASTGGQVLGANTMASTGAFDSIVSNVIFSLGLAFTTLASAGYAKKKKIS